MKVNRIKITNILGLENLEIQPGSITEITGANGTGKTSFLEAIKAALGGGHDASLLRVGAEKGEVVLVLDDGVEIKRTVTAEKSTTKVKHPTFGNLSKPADYLKKLTDALSVNPVEFLSAKPKDRVDALLSALPMQLDVGQIGFVPAGLIKFSQINLDDHAMVALEAVRRAMFDARTGINRSLKDKQATARQLLETVPEAPPEGDWKTQLKEAESEYSVLRGKTSTALASIKKEADEAVSAETHEFLEDKDKAKINAEANISRIREQLDQSIAGLTAAHDNAINTVREIEQQKRAELEADYRPKEAELKERIGHAKAMVEQEVKAAETRKLAARMEDEAQKLSEESKSLTDGLTKLETMKSGMISSLPIPGLEVRDGEIYVNDVPFDRVNESARIRLAIEVAKLRAGDLGLIAVDGAECMDSASFAEFEKAAAESGLQFIVSMVSDSPLAINGREAA